MKTTVKSMNGAPLRCALPAFLAFTLISLTQIGCGESLSTNAAGDNSVAEDRKKHDMRMHSPDLGGPSPDLSGHGHDMGHKGPDLSGGPVPNPPPAMCDQRKAGVTSIQVVVRVDQYQGIIHGFNGDHEIAYGTVTDQVWVFDNTIVDTTNVQLAMNVHSATDPSGLPNEIPLSVGQSVQVEGEYIPASTANAHDNNGAAAVIHYTHSPCGWVIIGGTQYN